jgi:ribosomal-protein-alanine N-acetyltransferase
MAGLEIEIETERLLLRLCRPEDVDDLCLVWGDPLVTKYIAGGEPIPRERVEAFIIRSREFWDRHGFGQLAVVHREHGRVIGYCGFKFLEETGEVELLYGLAHEYWNKGLVTEAAKACLRFAFEETGLERIVAVAQHANAGSYRVMEKSGMRYEKEARHFDQDVVCYVITRAEYQPDGSPYILNILRVNQTKDD